MYRDHINIHEERVFRNEWQLKRRVSQPVADSNTADDPTTGVTTASGVGKCSDVVAQGK